MTMSSSTLTEPCTADAAQVVAAEVDEHDVLGPFLGVGAQLGDEAAVLRRVRAARARTGDRPRLHVVVVDRDERLGARAAEGEVVEGDEEHVGARIHGAQTAIDGEGETRSPGRRSAG